MRSPCSLLQLLPSVLLASTSTYGLDMVNAADVWDRASGAGVVVAIVDSGVDLDHPALAPHLVAGIDLVDGDDQPDDLNGHGTHVAGIVVAAAPAVSILPVRVFDAEGGASNELIASGVDAAVAAGADIVNLSLGDSGLGDRLRRGGAINRAIDRAANAGVIVVSAAGNDGQQETVYRNAISLVVVAAVGPDGERASFSNYGDDRTVAAPGVDITSTAPTEPTALFPQGTDGTGTLSGTSMAAPFVAAEAAVLRSAGFGYDEALGRISSSARPGDPSLGAGIVDFAAAMADVPAITTTTTEAPASTIGSGSMPPSSSSTTSVGEAVPDGSGGEGGTDGMWAAGGVAGLALAIAGGVVASRRLRRGGP